MAAGSLYILNEAGDAEECRDVVIWGLQCANADRILAHDRLHDGSEIVTAFLSVNYNQELNGPPLLWETRVFPGTLAGCLCTRSNLYSTRGAAVVGHNDILREVVSLLSALRG